MGALGPAVYVTDEDVEQNWSQYRPLRDTTVLKIRCDLHIGGISFAVLAVTSCLSENREKAKLQERSEYNPVVDSRKGVC